ncbi:MAG: lipid-A-disaccharide synthase, partial [Bacteroidaceae bacterium]|nr:lipid-A-disaccharide synthase [Bacteroidaceae bacterium]
DIAKYVKANKICPVYYYISPKIWAWKEYRIKNIKRDVDELFSILPFEVEFFEQKHHYPIHYVGNPCVDAIQEAPSTPPKGGAPIPQSIAILAGSRKQEIKDNLAMMLRAASQFPEYQLVLAGAPNIPLEFYQKYIPKDIQVDIQFGKTYEILRQSAAALVTSGTATLETAILRIPQVVCYYTPMGRFISFLRSKLLKVKYISLVNLVVNREIVRELVADTMKEENIVKELRDILPGGTKRQQMLTDYEEMNRILGPAGASERAGKTIVELLRNKVKMKNEKMRK